MNTGETPPGMDGVGMEVREACAGYVVEAGARVPKGYKQTEVGVIPEDWEQHVIGDLAVKVGSGITPTGGSNTYKAHGRAFVRSQNVGWGKLQLAELAYIDELTHQTFPATELQLGDVLLNITGASIGRSAVADSRVVGGNVNQHVCIIRVDKSRTETQFMGYFLLSQHGQGQIDSFQAGGNREGLNFAQVRSIKLALPPTKAEQEAIAEALSDADARIESLEQLLAKKRQIKQGAMQELLTGKQRLPGFEINPGYKQTEVGVIPEDWGLDYIENLAHITTGSRNTQDRVDDGKYPFFVRSQTVERINGYSFEGEAVLTAGDGVGTGKVFHYIKGKFDAHQRVYRISDFNDCINGYFFFLYFSSHFYSRIMQMTAKSSVDSVRREMIARMLIPLPPTKVEQTAIATLLSDMDAELASLEAKLAKARQLKQGMMQELLTGRIRLI